MKRLLLAIILVVMSGAVAGSLYAWLRVPTSDERCTMDWLARELALESNQYEEIWAVHVRRCSEISSLQGSNTQPACEQVTELLIKEVSAVLTAEQRGRYLQLVATCRQQSASAP
jgi:hypothetical protein